MRKKVVKIRRKTLAVIFFLINLNILVLPMYALLYQDFSYLPAQIFLAKIITASLKALGYNASSSNQIVTLKTSQEIVMIEMVFDCTGWKSLYLLTALAFAITYPLKKKLTFLLLGLPFVFFLNYLRVLTTIVFALQYGFRNLEIVHTLLWREGLIMAVVLVWYLWLRRENYNIEQIKLFFR